MIRLTALLVRNPSLTHDAFVRHWHDVHGPLIRDTPELARHIVRYEQHPIADSKGAARGDYDGVAVQWFRSIDDLFAFIAEPAYAERVHADERQLLDFDRIQVTFTEEPIVMIGEGAG